MISEVEALKIFNASSLPEGQLLLSVKLAAASKSERWEVIRTDDDVNKRQIAAVIEIQRRHRGYRTRCHMQHHLAAKTSNAAVYSGSRELAARLDDMQVTEEQEEAQAEEKKDDGLNLRTLYEAYCAALIREGKEPASYETFLASYQDHLDNKEPSRKSEENIPKQEHGNSPPSSTPKKIRMREVPPTVQEAAMIIQRAWRRHIDIQVFHYYRDLINFRQRGNPQHMLKCINPREAGFLDAAAGVHIKFRLAGERFPPNIYYKIYTHRNIVDMCANSPKDYTDAACKRRAMKDVHNKNARSERRVKKDGPDGGWYERWENNGWRLVSDRLIQHVTVDPVTWETANKKSTFHHDKLQRRQDVDKKRRLKKIEWMKQMYRDGMMKTRVTDKETIQLIEGAAAGMVAAVEEEGPDAVKEWEVDELLEWTTTLSFDEYIDTWKGIATSAKSEAITENKNLESYRQYLEMQSLKAYQSESRARLLSSYDGDPYMLSLMEGANRPNQSYNTASTPSELMA